MRFARPQPVFGAPISSLSQPINSSESVVNCVLLVGSFIVSPPLDVVAEGPATPTVWLLTWVESETCQVALSVIVVHAANLHHQYRLSICG